MIEGAHPMGEKLTSMIKVSFCTDGSTVKMAISSNFDMITDMLKDIEKHYVEIFKEDEQSFDFNF